MQLAAHDFATKILPTDLYGLGKVEASPPKNTPAMSSLTKKKHNSKCMNQTELEFKGGRSHACILHIQLISHKKMQQMH
jgi:hypothetical protein